MQDAMTLRKDCGPFSHVDATRGAGRPALTHRVWAWLALAPCTLTSTTFAETVRLWPCAVVVHDAIQLSDVSAITGFDPTTERQIATLRVTDAPAPGTSRVVDLELVRTALITGGVNMASLTLTGVSRCTVSRPGERAPADSGKHRSNATFRTVGDDSAGAKERSEDPKFNPPPQAAEGHTLRQAVTDYFNATLAPYGGKAQLAFDTSSRQVLDLSGPAYQFNLRRRNGPLLGLNQVEVDVLSDGRTLQTAPLVAQVSMVRPAVVARRAINQGATVQAQDVHATELSFTKLDQLGLDHPAQVIGQRAKRFIAAGTMIDSSLLDAVPLVTRGQLVTLASTAGAVRVLTAAKALDDGLLGETIAIRALDNQRVELEAVVIGPGAVQIGAAPDVRASSLAKQADPSS